jgi:hypothetical protein
MQFRKHRDLGWTCGVPHRSLVGCLAAAVGEIVMAERSMNCSGTLNIGAYDVLAKPFDRKEVIRILSLAWLHWRDQHEIPTRVMNLLKLASGM